MEKEVVKVLPSGTDELMKNTKINMTMTEWAAAVTIIIGEVCAAVVMMRWIRTYENLESKKLSYYYEHSATIE